MTHAAGGGALATPDGRVGRAAPGFIHGFSALPDGLRFLAAERRCWLAASVPSLILLGLAVPAFWLAFTEVGPRLGDWMFPHAGAWYLEGGHWLVRWLGSLVAAFFGFWLALVVAPTASAPALEYLVRAREAELGVFERPRASLWLQLRCGMEAQIGALLVAVPLWFGCWLLGIAFPPLLLLFPLQALPGALALAWNLLDYPLSLRGVRLRARWQLMRQHPAAMLGFAACLALVASIPGGVFLLLPAGVVGATRLSWELLPEGAPPAPRKGQKGDTVQRPNATILDLHLGVLSAKVPVPWRTLAKQSSVSPCRSSSTAKGSNEPSSTSSASSRLRAFCAN